MSSTPDPAGLSLTAPMVSLVGHPKTLKTSGLLRLFPEAICFGDRSSIEVIAVGSLGLPPKGCYSIYPLPVRFLEDFPEAIEKVLGKIGLDELRRRGIIIDDATFRANATANRLLDRAKASWDGNGANPGWTDHKLRVRRFFEEMRALQVPVGFTWHLLEERRNKRGQLLDPYAVDVGSRSRSDDAVAACDLIMYGIKDANMLEIWPDARVAGVSSISNTNYIAGDRFQSGYDGQPFNPREHINASAFMQGQLLPRPKGMEWQDDAAQYISDTLVKAGMRGSPDVQEAVITVFQQHGTLGASRAVPLLPRHPKDLHCRWAVQDGFARAQFRTAQERDVFSMGGVLGFGGGGSGGAADFGDEDIIA